VFVGEQAEKRKRHDIKTEKLLAERNSLDGKIAEQNEKATELGRKAAKLAPDAVGGSEKALAEQHKFLTEKSKAELQAVNLETLAAPIRAEHAAAVADRPRLVQIEALEILNEQPPKIAGMADLLAKRLADVVPLFVKFRDEYFGVIDSASQLLGNRGGTLTDRARSSFVLGINAGLQTAFRQAGIIISNSSDNAGETFATVIERPMNNLRRAVEVDIHTLSDTPVAGRQFYVTTTRIGGLFGRDFLPNEKISLPADDPAVKRLISQGALKEVGS
jgi:hypothetical protein